jgi:TolB-like protein/Tfp pilus assembly protein PilF
MNPRNFFAELKRRNVYKVAVAYVVAAWLLTQVATQVFPFFEIPNWAVRLVVVVLILGFPIALVLAWAFEITPEGIKREEDVAPDRSIAPRTGRKLVGITIALAVAAAGLFSLRFLHPKSPPRVAASETSAPAATAVPTAIPEKSIAVLPFENLSDDKQNAYFADGVQDEILTDLAKIADLKVISRTSVMQYKIGVQRNLREIGQQLGVAHLLEGSVQRAAGKVRVNAQLIDARSDAHLWAENYDRPLDDVFAIQTEIAKTIADQLQAHLSPNEKAAIEEKPTSNLQAYEQFVRGRDVVESYLDRTDQRADLLMAVDRLDDATRRDPGFELAYCYLARAHDLIFFLGFDPAPDRRAKAEAAIEHALRLRPDSGEAHLARGGHFLRCYRDYKSADAEIAIARPSLPNSAPLYTLSGYIERRLGHWENSTREMEKAFDRDPRNPTTYDLLTDNYILTREFTKAAKMDQEQAAHTGIDPRMAAVNLALVDFAVTGQTTRTETALASLPGYIDPGSGQTAPRVLMALIRGDYAAASAALAASTQTYFQDVDFSFHYPRSWYEAQIARAAGDHARMVTAFAATRKIFEALPDFEGNPRIMAVVAQVDAGLGNNPRALQEAQQAVEQMPISRDAYDGPLVLQGLAQVYVITGDKEKAEGALETLVKVPGYLSYGYLLKDPMWGPLRNDARFQTIVNSLAPKTNAF